MSMLFYFQLLQLMYFFYFSYGNKYLKKPKYSAFPNCKHCKHYRFSLTNHEFSKCSKFVNEIKKYNIVIYEYADLMRLDQEKCGKEGRYYENKEYRDMLDIITDTNNNIKN